MRQSISETRNYTISVDTSINRLYIVLRGFWLDPSQIPDYVGNISTAVGVLSGPFTALVDVREMHTPGHLVKDIHVAAQKICISSGLRKSAEIFPEGISKQLELEEYSLESKLFRRSFRSIVEAELWLDSTD